MAVNSITFGGVNSADFGIYISGEGVFNAPKRDVEMISIPGRNGAFALDNGRFENIEVTYPAFNFEPDDYDTFMQNLSDFRNAICSQRGYQRLTDTFHPDEYRMATYIGGLEIKPVKYNTASEFNIVFDCKPQRWLTSGETATAVANNGTVTNPTLFDSEPLLAIKGYGTIGFNGYEVELDNAVLGRVDIKSGGSSSSLSGPYPISFTEHVLNAADTITLESSYVRWKMEAQQPYFQTLKVDSNTGISGSSAELDGTTGTGRYKTVRITLPSLTFAKGTASSYTNTTAVSGTRVGGGIYSAQFILSIAYDGADTITFSFTDSYTGTGVARVGVFFHYGDIIGYSTQSILGNPTYIDCELGDAYKYESGEYVSLNGNVELGSDLPKLAPGSNTVTFDNTVTELKITPRWWKV